MNDFQRQLAADCDDSLRYRCDDIRRNGMPDRVEWICPNAWIGWGQRWLQVLPAFLCTYGGTAWRCADSAESARRCGESVIRLDESVDFPSSRKRRMGYRESVIEFGGRAVGLGANGSDHIVIVV
jgi:hypothetical protein